MDACRIISISSAIFVACKFPWHWTLLLEADGRIWTLAGTLLLGAISCILVVVIKLKFLYVMMTGDTLAN
jgi:hypothetical protein